MQNLLHDGSREPAVLFDEDEMLNALARSEVKEVRVFRLEVGQQVTIEGHVYEVKKILSRGRVQLKCIGEAEGKSN